MNDDEVSGGATHPFAFVRGTASGAAALTFASARNADQVPREIEVDQAAVGGNATTAIAARDDGNPQRGAGLKLALSEPTGAVGMLRRFVKNGGRPFGTRPVSGAELPSPLSSPLAPSNPAHRYGRERPPEWVDEQRDRSGLRRNRPLEGLDRVKQLVVLQARLLDHDDRVVGRFIAGLEEREYRIRGIFPEAVASFARVFNRLSAGSNRGETAGPIQRANGTSSRVMWLAGWLRPCP